MPHAPLDSRPPGARGRLAAPIALALLAAALLAALLMLFGSDDDDLSPRPVTVAIAGETVTVAANRIRFSDQRRGGALPRLDLAVLWPGLAGRTTATADAFAGRDGAGTLIQIAVEPRAVDLDSAARLASVYVRQLAPQEPDAAEAPPVTGLVARRFLASSPYADETLYFEPGAVHPFVARCFPRAAGDTRKLCLTEIGFGRGLVAAVRFPPALLGDWQALQSDLAAFLAGLTASP
jgi:hypothetical protein